MEATFFAAEFAGGAMGPAEHDLHWIGPDEPERPFDHQCHAWAARQLPEVRSGLPVIAANLRGRIRPPSTRRRRQCFLRAEG
jgi:hypothetical protein